MKFITSSRQMQCEALRLKRSGKKIAFVPTMGALHAGHLSLINLARKRADVVILSIYVNPAQFGPREDFKRYPRPFAQDYDLAKTAGATYLFAPKNLYAADASTTVQEKQVAVSRCGELRLGHFDGVATVVTILFNVVQPDIAVFGQKDAQQCDVIERIVRDLHLPVKILRGPILRDAKGLALSSRNQYLSGEEYENALSLPQALKEAAKSLSPQRAEKTARHLLSKNPQLCVQYVEAVGGRLCAAVMVGKTRLIDNVPLKR
ncbi:MAG: pantoate--beta-alanine ligase [Blastochloris sp.]|nr:pantoate--beta-alanine ligase [Blastochloris sp.]